MLRSDVERRGPVPQRVFKTRQAWQPHAGSVRLRGRSVKPKPAPKAGFGVYEFQLISTDGEILETFETAEQRWATGDTEVQQLATQPECRRQTTVWF